ncbi:potassium/proton antiporter [Mesonia maritima]|uniref:Cell volume regulation protein A n=1 Tax=Mesonia maritima TaxID=1793873 RepID=A0ABU1K2M2_9FLAO|nr:potassium/proton antiporter [Mesonia maritima]MDR6299859.1 cell volume regulation protein A [Mesonia maritima]
MNLAFIILIGSFLLLISILAGKTSYRFGVPTLVLFLAVGMLAGSEGLLGINFDSPLAAQFVGIIALNVILFSGGLDTRWNAVKPVLYKGGILATLGVFITAGTVGIFTYYLLDFTLAESFLLGAIISSTDAAAVFSILRSNNVNLKGGIRPLLELESGSNDPMAYFLTTLLTGIVLVNEFNVIDSILELVLQISIGAVLGFGLGKLSKLLINRIALDFEGLYPVLGISLSFIIYSLTEVLSGNGFLAVYISSVLLGNSKLIRKNSLREFFDGFAWLMQIILFLTLGLLVFPSHIIPVALTGLFIALFLILVARPLSVFISLAFFKVPVKNKLFISWVGLRGAVPIVFATFPMVAGLEKADLIFNIVFIVTLVSIMLQGTTIIKMAKWLGVEDKNTKSLKKASSFAFSDETKTETAEIILTENSLAVNKKLYQLKLPKNTLIVMIIRNNKYFVPEGSTKLQVGDTLQLISAKSKDLDIVAKKFG